MENTNEINIARLREIEKIDHLVVESLFQGFRFVNRLVENYRCGRNCFDKCGEILLVAFVEEKAIAICGLNRDPYSDNPTIGRLRHLYVESNWRRCGVGSSLVFQIIDEAKQHYKMLILRTDTPEADKFYRMLGFKTNIDSLMPHATHFLRLSH